MSETHRYNSAGGFWKPVVSIAKLLPKPIARCLYSIFHNTPGKIGFGVRYLCISRLVKRCGCNVAIFPYVILKNIDKLSIGDNVSIHSFSYIDCWGGIEIGDNVSIAHNCSLVSFNHTWDDASQPIKYNPVSAAPIKLNNDIWLGCGVRIIGPCEIESRVVVAAGAVAKGHLQKGSLYAGVPAKLIKSI